MINPLSDRWILDHSIIAELHSMTGVQDMGNLHERNYFSILPIERGMFVGDLPYSASGSSCRGVCLARDLTGPFHESIRRVRIPLPAWSQRRICEQLS